MYRFCFVFSENTKIYAALRSQILKQNKASKILHWVFQRFIFVVTD